MAVTLWWCDTCGKSDAIVRPDSLPHMDAPRVRDAHRAASPECQVPVVLFLRATGWRAKVLADQANRVRHLAEAFDQGTISITDLASLLAGGSSQAAEPVLSSPPTDEAGHLAGESAGRKP